MAGREAQAALLNVMHKEVTRIVLFDEWDGDFHIFVKQMRAQNRGRPDVKLARLCLQMATTLFGEELGRDLEMRRDAAEDDAHDGGGFMPGPGMMRHRAMSAAHDIGRNSYDTDGEEEDDDAGEDDTDAVVGEQARARALARMSQFQGATPSGPDDAATRTKLSLPAPQSAQKRG